MRIAPARLAAVVLAVLVVAGLGLGARCTSAARARCSPAMLFGRTPTLDVPYAPTRPGLVARMLEMAELRAGDRVLDLGTGDGRILRAAAAQGAVGTGVDIDPVYVREATAAAAREGVADRVRFVAQDLFATPLAGYDVVTMYLLPAVNLRLRPRLQRELAPGARIVSHAFTMGDWQPDATAQVGGARAYMWIVPARVAGRWRMDDGRVIDIHQTHQDVATLLAAPGDYGRPVGDMRLRGAKLRFVADGRTYAGEVRGDAIIGDGWRAERMPVEENGSRAGETT